MPRLLAVMLYNQAAADLGAIRAWWLALPPSEQVRPATIDRLVDRSEDIMKAEHGGWVQQMQDAMTKFRLDGAEDERSDAGRQGGPPTDRQPPRLLPMRSRQQALDATGEPLVPAKTPDLGAAGPSPFEPPTQEGG